jgi:hypothetical protein
VGQQASDLTEEHADELGALRDGQTQQLLGRQAEGMLLVHRRDVVEPVEIRDRLQVGLMLDQLLGAPMQEPDMRIDTLDDFTVKLKHQPEHTVGRRMLRTKIDGEIAQLRFGHYAPILILLALSASRSWNLSQRTTNRWWRPSPIESTPS